MIADLSRNAMRERIAPNQTLVPVATGKAHNGGEYTVTVAPNYLAFQDRMAGALLYRRNQPIDACDSSDQRQGWLDERADERGRAAYLRALEAENCPPEWADKYVSVPLDFQPPF